jgi:hypothetical protein
LKWPCEFLFWFYICIVYDYWFVHVEPFLQLHNETTFTMLYDFSNVLWTLICKYLKIFTSMFIKEIIP